MTHTAIDRNDGNNRDVVRPRPRGWWGVSLGLFAVLVVYVSSFWGFAARYLPAPLDRWAYFYRPLIEPWWLDHVLTDWPRADRVLALWLTASVVLGMIVPALVLGLARRTPVDMGLGAPNRLGRRLILVSVLVSIPFGIWLLSTTTLRPGQKLIDARYVINLLAMIPEHYLICGVATALMLPARRLPSPVPLAPVEGPRWRRALRWLGLAQPVPSPRGSRIAAWFGLDGPAILAIAASGGLFGLVHLGKENLLEVVTSFPGGVAVAYVTLRSHSIWPAVLAHWAMNLLPLGLLAAARAIQ